MHDCPASAPTSHGRVFISYRRDDEGSALAEATHRLVCASGAVPWFDLQALMARAWDDVIDEALTDCAGGILLVTRGVAHSSVIRETEAPRLLNRAKPVDAPRAGLPLAIITDAFTERGPDLEEITRRLGSADPRWASVQTFEATADGVRAAVSAVACETIPAVQDEVRVAINTRRGVFDDDARAASQEQHFRIHLDSAATLNLVEPETYHALQRMLDTDYWSTGHPRHLWGLIGLAAPGPDTRLSVELGAHMSVSFGMGFALPVTRFTSISVRPTGRKTDEVYHLADHQSLTSRTSTPESVTVARRTDRTRRDAIGAAANDQGGAAETVPGVVILQFAAAADETVIASALAAMECSLHITPQIVDGDPDWLLTPSNLAGRVAATAREITAFVRANGITELHLGFSGPAVFAFALGRALATASIPPIVVYDYVNDGQAAELRALGGAPDADHGSGYLPTCRLTYNSGPMAAVYDWREVRGWLGGRLDPEPVSDFRFTSVVRDGRDSPAKSASTIVVLTPHDLVIVPDPHGDEELVLSREEGSEAIRLPETHYDEWTLEISGSRIPFATIGYDDADVLPPETDGTIYVVSRVVAAAHRHRRDLFFPLNEFRDGQGQIVGCRGLGRLAR